MTKPKSSLGLLPGGNGTQATRDVGANAELDNSITYNSNGGIEFALCMQQGRAASWPASGSSARQGRAVPTGTLGGKVKAIEISLWRNTAAKWKQECMNRNLPTSGSKEILIRRICIDIHSNLARMNQKRNE